MERCTWPMNEINIIYHDAEWGVPVHDDRKQFEYMMLEVMQCGLNWNMMLLKREIFRSCFDSFDYNKIVNYTEDDIIRIMNTEGMIRSRRKIEAVIHNAKMYVEVQKEFGSFSEYLWGFTNGNIYLYQGHQKGQIPAKNGLSEKISKDLKKRGFKYLGAVTVYSHLQACGIINDHMESCFRFQEIMKGHQVAHKRRNHEA